MCQPIEYLLRMKRIGISIIVVLINLSTIIAQQTHSTDLRDFTIQKLDSCLNIKAYSLADIYASEIVDEDSLPYNVVENIAYTLFKNDKYMECVNFIDKWQKKYPDKTVFFNHYKGYALVSDGYTYDAEPFIEKYIKESEKGNEPTESLAYYALAYAKFRNYKYSEAEKNFEKYFQNVAEEEKSNIEYLYLCSNKDNYGKAFYFCAYNYFYLGNEVKGDYFLNLAIKTGNKEAKKDHYFLSQNQSYAKPLTLKRKYQKQYDDWINVFGIYKNGPENDVDAFWEHIENTSPEIALLKQQYARKKPQKSLRKAMAVVEKGRKDLNMTLQKFNPNSVGKIENLIQSNLLKTNDRVKELRIYKEEIPNAFATPYGQIYLTQGLVERLNSDNDLITTVCAHEMTHYVLQHSLIGLWKTNKRNKRNQIWGGIFAGLTIAAALHDSYNNTYRNNNYRSNYSWYYANLASDILMMFDLSTRSFSFKYDRIQELEADYIAYRFCEANDIGGYAYIIALELLGNDDTRLKAEEYSDHPTINYRVQFLKYLYNKEHTNHNE